MSFLCCYFVRRRNEGIGIVKNRTAGFRIALAEDKCDQKDHTLLSNLLGFECCAWFGFFSFLVDRILWNNIRYAYKRVINGARPDCIPHLNNPIHENHGHYFQSGTDPWTEPEPDRKGCWLVCLLHPSQIKKFTLGLISFVFVLSGGDLGPGGFECNYFLGKHSILLMLDPATSLDNRSADVNRGLTIAL